MPSAIALAIAKRVMACNILRICIRGNLGERWLYFKFLESSFTIDLMPVELGSFDAIIGMDWLRRHYAMIVCDEKLIRVPFRNETLISATREDDKPEGKQVKDVPIIQDFPKVFSENLPDLLRCYSNGKVAYKLKLPKELSRVHHTLHVSNVKKCYSDKSLVMPLEGVHINGTLQFMGEPVKIMEREIKQLKQSRIPLVKVCWNSRRGHEFTWERED
uniref:Putative reverse transcriptase domain-containing protein n=1 Tax=Tanacetum cinerariifolium TaxID=118510 RepID=A0A699KIG5_TANCI|nr:putative reverse transcriptase domain-containing protein [Tanacetum cinerariifolium]